MITQIKGKITSVFGDDTNTDDIIPAWTLPESTDRSFFGQFAFQNIDPDFINRCNNNETNIIVAGKNFGCGSSREQAIYALLENHVAAVIAESFPDIFYRNALNNGLILITVKDIKPFKLNSKIVMDLFNKKIGLNGRNIRFNMSEEDTRSFMMGGKIGKIRKHLQEILSLRHTDKSLTRRGPSPGFIGIRMTPKPQTIVEKIISDHAGKLVTAGEKLAVLPIDILFFNEVIGPPAINDFLFNFGDIYKNKKMKPAVFDPGKIFFIPDHTVPSSSVSVAEGITLMEEFARTHKIKCYKEGDGIEHAVLIEDGYIVPGKIILGTDSHTDTNGALNTMAFGVGTTDASYALATGYLYDFETPKTIRVNLSGKFHKGVYPKDLIIYLIGKLGVDGASKKVVEFGGTAFTNISMDGRTTITNMAVEMGARTAIFEPDEILKKYLSRRAKFAYKTYLPDPDCSYEQIINVDLSLLLPMVSFPHKPSYATAVDKLNQMMRKSQKSDFTDFAKVKTLEITDAFLGACTNGRYEDFAEAAKILKGRKIHKNVNFIAIPASRNVYNRLMKDGILGIFADAGSNIQSSNCGPCFGKHMGVVGRGAQMISSSNRNYIGRMGSKDAKIFLASPVTVAASAVAGKIVDPRKYL